jgi:hypothetical protein
MKTRLTDIFVRDVAKDQGPFRLVLWLIKGVFDQLVHGSDTTSASDTESLVKGVWLVLVLGDRTFEKERLAD